MGFLVLFQFTLNSSSHTILNLNQNIGPVPREGLGSSAVLRGTERAPRVPSCGLTRRVARPGGPPVSAKVLRGIV